MSGGEDDYSQSASDQPQPPTAVETAVGYDTRDAPTEPQGTGEVPVKPNSRFTTNNALAVVCVAIWLAFVYKLLTINRVI